MSVKQSQCASQSVRQSVRAALALAAVAMMASAAHVAVADDANSTSSQSNTVAQNDTAAQGNAAGPTAGTSETANAAGSPVALEEITVTGSRIKRKDYTSYSPLVTIDASELEQRAGLNIESYLNQLPQYNPAETPVTEAEDVQPSAVNTVGISTISLRGLGPNRSLVLVDGHRTTPVNALMVTDINTIPSGMIDHIETISGGASATYGADAMGGVTNFILKKNFQGLSLDVQDGLTQVGDGNELRVNVLMGTKFADGKGNIIMGGEYYDRGAAYEKNRSFYTDAWSDPNATATNAIFMNGYNAFAPQDALPSTAALQAIFGSRYASGSQAAGPYGGFFTDYNFNPAGTYGGTLFAGQTLFGTNNGFLNTSNYQGPTSGNGFGVENCLDTNNGNVINAGNTVGVQVLPTDGQCLKWNNPTGLLSLPQARYSFYGKGTFDLTDNIQFFTNVRFAESQTQTELATPTSAINGWSATVPFNPTTDSPILPSAITSATSASQISAILSSLVGSNGQINTASPYYNTGYIGPSNFSNVTSLPAGSQHPVPAQLAAMLLSRSVFGVPGLNPGGPLVDGGPVVCNSALNPALCSASPYNWDLSYLPGVDAAPQRSTTDTDSSWQIETGFDFPLYVGDWTGELYYSRGQTQTYQQAYGNDSLARYQAIVQSPGYGQGLTFQGNYASVNPNFGNSVPATCASGLFATIFYDEAPSADCQNAISATLQTMTQIEQDIVEANFQGSLFKLPAGEVSAAVGYQSRRDSAVFTPDGLQSTNSFLDETVGLYPLGSLNAQTIARDGYGELEIPVVKDLSILKELNFDLGGRYSTFDDAPNSTTFKVDMDAKIGDSIRLRGGFNKATRAPNLGELFLNEQEYFGGGPNYGDPCSVRSKASFGAGGAAPDTSASGSPTGASTAANLVNSGGAAGAESAYLICLAQIGALNPNGTVNTSAPGYVSYYGAGGNQSTDAAGGGFAWLNEEGNPNLNAETADTWTGGVVFSNLGDNAWLRSLQASLDWWSISIRNAIELDSVDYANYLCYGTADVTNYAQAEAQANSAACQNVPRSTTNGGALTQLLQYENLATIHTSGIDLGLNWFSQFADLGLGFIPGGFAFNSQDTMLINYYTKASPLNFDVNTNWKDSFGPSLVGTDGGAFGYRLFQTFSWVLPSVSFSLHWEFLPSINSATHASTAAIEAYDAKLPAGSPLILAYTPDNTLAAAHYNKLDFSFNWNINKILSLRGGINNLFDTNPPITGATTGYAANVNYCAGMPQGCQLPASVALPNDGAGSLAFGTPAGFYDVLGRTFFLGVKAQF